MSLAVVPMLKGYFGYRRNKRKEDDRIVREKLMREINKSQRHLMNVQENFYEKKDSELTAAVRKIKDELDIFSNEVKLSEVGHKYPFFSAKSSAGAGQIKKLVNYDDAMIGKMLNVAEICKVIEDNLIDSKKIDYSRELAKLRQYITQARNDYNDRLDYVKGLK